MTQYQEIQQVIDQQTQIKYTNLWLDMNDKERLEAKLKMAITIIENNQLLNFDTIYIGKTLYGNKSIMGYYCRFPTEKKYMHGLAMDGLNISRTNNTVRLETIRVATQKEIEEGK